VFSVPALFRQARPNVAVLHRKIVSC